MLTTMTTIVALLIIGTVLVFLETIMIGGVLGFLGALCYCAAAYFAYIDHGAIAATITIIAELVATFSAMYFCFRILPKTSLGKSIYLDSRQSGKAQSLDLKSLIGKNATALTDMNPSGKVEIDGIPFDARCESRSAKVGEKLAVIGANSFELVVRKI